MKILWFVDKQFDVSLDRVTWLEMIRHLQKRNEVILVTGFRDSKPQFKELRGVVVYIDSPQKRYFKRIGFFKNQIKDFESLLHQFKPTTLLFNTQNSFLIKKAALAGKKYGIRVFLDVRTLPVSPKRNLNLIEKVFFNQCLNMAARESDGISYITEEMRNYCIHKFHLPPHNSEVWTSGVDIGLFKPDGFTSSDETLRIIYHGSVSENRGLANLIKALNLMKDGRIKITFLGGGSGLRELQRLVAALNLNHQIFFHAPVPYHEVPKYISEADVGVLPFPDWPGWNTSSPIKLFEYLACGKPVIVTRIRAHLRVLEGKEFAFWADISDPEAIAGAIAKARDSKGILKLLGQRARQLAMDNYAWEIQAEKLENFLKREAGIHSG